MPHDLGPTPIGEDFFACVNLWMLDQALAYDAKSQLHQLLRLSWPETWLAPRFTDSGKTLNGPGKRLWTLRTP
jgi:hypothetical protein